VRVSPPFRAVSHLVAGLALATAATTASAQVRPGGPPPGAVRVPAKIPDSLAARLPKTPKMPSSDQEVFTQRDLRARNVLGYFDCLARTVKASREGGLGVVPPTSLLVCVLEKGEWRGVVAEPVNKFPGVAVRTQLAMRGAGAVVKEPIDTFNVLVIARGVRRAVQAKATTVGAITVSPVVLPYDSYLEILYVPVPTENGALFVGGDSIIQMAPDGSRELGHSRSAPPMTPLTVNAGKKDEAVIQSTQPQVPLVSELVAARALLPRFRVVTLQSADYTFTLTRAAAAKSAGPLGGTWKTTTR
jgi:hypothetical protein